MGQERRNDAGLRHYTEHVRTTIAAQESYEEEREK